MRELAGAVARFHPVKTNEGRRRVDRIHHIVERPRQGVNVLPVDRRDEGAVEALDDLVGQEVALVLDFLDFVCLVPDGVFGRQHLFQQPAPLRISSARARKSAKNFSSRGISLKRHATSWPARY